MIVTFSYREGVLWSTSVFGWCRLRCNNRLLFYYASVYVLYGGCVLLFYCHLLHTYGVICPNTHFLPYTITSLWVYSNLPGNTRICPAILKFASKSLHLTFSLLVYLIKYNITCFFSMRPDIWPRSQYWESRPNIRAHTEKTQVILSIYYTNIALHQVTTEAENYRTRRSLYNNSTIFVLAYWKSEKIYR